LPVGNQFFHATAPSKGDTAASQRLLADRD
jgi:hypothetical protein